MDKDSTNLGGNMPIWHDSIFKRYAESEPTVLREYKRLYHAKYGHKVGPSNVLVWIYLNELHFGNNNFDTVQRCQEDMRKKSPILSQVDISVFSWQE